MGEQQKFEDSPYGDAIAALPLFQGLPLGARKALRRWARVETHQQRDVFVNQGEYNGQFYVVLEGLVSALRTEDTGEVRRLRALGASDWFGDVSALSSQPSLATLKVDSPHCIVVVLDAALFKELYRARSPFRERVDEHYRERALALHLRLAPLFRDLSNEELDVVRSAVQLKVFEKDAVLARQDEPTREIYLVRSGAVACQRVDEHGHHRITSYFMSNSSFGERALMETGRWGGDHVALARTDVLVMPIDGLRDRIGGDSALMRRLEQAAGMLVAEEEGVSTGIFDRRGSDGPSPDELEIMVRRQSIKGGRALVIDLARCVRCNACVESCVAVHADGIPRLSKKGNRIEGGFNLATSCYNCEIPECMLSCSYGAIRRDLQGLIRFVWDNCVGCAMCVSACPYDVIRMTAPPRREPAQKHESLLADLPLLGRLFKKASPAAETEPEFTPRGHEVNGKAVKCDLCAGLPFEACVYNCPTSAIGRMNPEELLAQQRSRSGS